MTKENRGVVMRINDASLELFGESNDTNRKRVRKLIDRGLLRATKLTGDGRGSPFWVTRASLDALIKQIDEDNEQHHTAA
tara:strand:+ start:1219 stop:1458 length:240 start_codon:yes stop_codon:yes gene_type:complete